MAAGQPNPYIDPDGFTAEVTIQETAFNNELKRQQVEGPPARRGGGGAAPQAPGRGAEVLTTDHYVKVVSTVPAIAGQVAQLYVRERATADTLRPGTNLSNRVVLFVHGAGTPAEVAFDVAYQDYSWMAALAQAGLDVFAMDVSGYGRSVRPWPMNDPCNLSAAQQGLFVPALMPAPCAASYAHDATTIGSDWNDIDAVVNHLRRVRGVERVSLVGWSLGGPRAGGYASAHPDKVRTLVLLSPAYSRGASSTPPAGPQGATAFNTQSRTEFDANWDRQLGCPNQFDMAAREAVWSAMIASDPVGATWGTGVRRAPSVTTWGWNRDAAAKLAMPLLLISPAHDAQVAPATVRALYDDAAVPQKVLVDSRLFVAQRAVGASTRDDVRGVARVSLARYRDRRARGRRQARVLTAAEIQ
jgi:pimeloyl-ACP methyl ester carboxylesterase